MSDGQVIDAIGQRTTELDKYIARGPIRTARQVLQASMDQCVDLGDTLGAVRIAEVLFRLELREGVDVQPVIGADGRPVVPLLDSDGKQVVAFRWSGELDMPALPAPARRRTAADIEADLEALQRELQGLDDEGVTDADNMENDDAKEGE